MSKKPITIGFLGSNSKKAAAHSKMLNTSGKLNQYKLNNFLIKKKVLLQ